MKLRWKELLLALLLSVGLWYVVAGSEKMESMVTVRVIYRGTPPGLVVLNGMVDKLEVRVRATPGMMRSVSGREIPVAMDLSGLRQGENILPVEANRLPFWGDVEVIEINPPRIQLEVDTLENKTVPVAVEVQGETPKGLVLQANVEPPQVELRGPSTRLREIKALQISVNASVESAPGMRTEKRSPALPDGVESIPPQVDLTVSVDHRRRRMQLVRPVEVENHGALGVFVRPNKVTVTTAMPEHLVDEAAAGKGIRAWVEAPAQAAGAYTLPVRVILPPGAELIKIEPAEVVLTLEQGG